ncbi:hypothetical protein [Actinoplanes auranticolor]|uniref:Uncharacterized protein n=1 Tax=Actinoplanes auranticolor TaxID=47988 RepID=A0A919SP70_9ACTN|nr:hypothetical protein [Actinoplanes auranticolor]GIM76440.1 hypothetical protein Aau02nite_70870 [Actinoplanes auranticolor]
MSHEREPLRVRGRFNAMWMTAALIAGGAAFLLAGLSSARSTFTNLAAGYQLWPGNYSQVWPWFRWIVGDTTEAGFQKDALAGVLMLMGAAIAHWGAGRGKRWAGFALSGGIGLFPWMAGSAFLGLLVSNAAWGWTIAVSGMWQPTFVPFVSLPSALVLVYGRGWAVALTGAVLGAGLTTPIALLLVNFVCRPTGLPNVVGTTTGMGVSALIAFPLCRSLPWLPRSAVSATREAGPDCPERGSAVPVHQGPFWVARRTLADFTEAQFYGNEWAGVGLIAGTLLSYGLNPGLPAYGSGLVPQLLTAQVLTAVLGVALWRRQWAERGWYPTFVPVVSIAPAVVLTYGGTVPAVLAGAVLGALVGPPLSIFIARGLPAGFHPFIGNVMSMAAGTALIVPLLGAVPGFRSP